jgi:acyl carrier protein
VPDSERPEGRAPQSDAEKKVSGLFEEVLQVRRAGLDDSFFLLGGDSITLMRLVGRAQESGLKITPRDVFQFSTVEALAKVVRLVT